MTTHVNKVHHVTTITRVAEQLGEDEDWLWDVASGMEIEDGVIWVYGVGDDGVLAFTDFDVESLIELIKMHKDVWGLEEHIVVGKSSAQVANQAEHHQVAT